MKIAIWCCGITPRWKKKELSSFFQDSFLFLFPCKNCIFSGDCTLHQKERFLKKWSCNPPCAFKLWLLYVEHKNKYYDYYYSIELELMLYIRCQRAWDQSFSFQYRRFLCDVKLSLIWPRKLFAFYQNMKFFREKSVLYPFVTKFTMRDY